MPQMLTVDQGSREEEPSDRERLDGTYWIDREVLDAARIWCGQGLRP